MITSDQKLVDDLLNAQTKGLQEAVDWSVAHSKIAKDSTRPPNVEKLPTWLILAENGIHDKATFLARKDKINKQIDEFKLTDEDFILANLAKELNEASLPGNIKKLMLLNEKYPLKNAKYTQICIRTLCTAAKYGRVGFIREFIKCAELNVNTPCIWDESVALDHALLNTFEFGGDDQATIQCLVEEFGANRLGSKAPDCNPLSRHFKSKLKIFSYLNSKKVELNFSELIKDAAIQSDESAEENGSLMEVLLGSDNQTNFDNFLKSCEIMDSEQNENAVPLNTISPNKTADEHKSISELERDFRSKTLFLVSIMKDPLMIAITYKNYRAARLLAERHVLLNHEIRIYYALLTAIRQDNLKSLLELIEMGSKLGIDLSQYTYKKYNYSTPTMVAAYFGATNSLRTLLQIDPLAVYTKDSLSCTPLHYSATVACSRMLIEAGGSIFERNTQGQTALFSAVSSGYFNIVRMLVEEGALVDERDKKGVTPLMSVSDDTLSSLKIVQYLVETAKSDIMAIDDDGENSLNFYARRWLFKQNVSIVLYLLSRGIVIIPIIPVSALEPKKSNEERRQLFQAQASIFKENVLKMLEQDNRVVRLFENIQQNTSEIKQISEISLICTEQGDFPLLGILFFADWLINERDVRIVILLRQILKEGVNGRREIDWNTALHQALISENIPKIISLLSSTNINIYLPNKKQQTPFDMAMSMEKFPLIQALFLAKKISDWPRCNEFRSIENQKGNVEELTPTIRQALALLEKIHGEERHLTAINIAQALADQRFAILPEVAKLLCETIFKYSTDKGKQERASELLYQLNMGHTSRPKSDVLETDKKARLEHMEKSLDHLVHANSKYAKEEPMALLANKVITGNPDGLASLDIDLHADTKGFLFLAKLCRDRYYATRQYQYDLQDLNLELGQTLAKLEVAESNVKVNTEILTAKDMEIESLKAELQRLGNKPKEAVIHNLNQRAKQ